MAAHVEKLQLKSGETINLVSWSANQAMDRAVVYLHGVESHSQWFAKTAEALASQGVAVYSFDRSGWGQSSGRRGYLASAAAAINELDVVLSLITQRSPSLHLVGMSWGGLLGLYYALQMPHKLDSLTLIAPGIIPRRDLSLTGKMNVVIGGIFGNSWDLELPWVPTDFTSNAQWQNYIAADRHRITKVSPSFCLATYRMRRAVIRGLRCGKSLPPTNVLLAEHDAIINNWATIDVLRHAQVRIISYEQSAHSLIFENPVRVAKDVSRLVFAVPFPRQKLA